MRLSEEQLREFGERGYVVVRGVIPAAALAAANAAIDRLVAESPPRPGHTGQLFYWVDRLTAEGEEAERTPIGVEGKGYEGREPATASPATAAATRAAVRGLMFDTPLRELARALVEPGAIGVAFDQAQIALNYPGWSHRPGRGHVDGCQYGADGRPGSFTALAGVLLSDQTTENAGNLWVWPGTHRATAALFREQGPEGLVASGHYPDVPHPEPEQVLGRAGDVVLAHYLLSHNTGGNYEGDRVRRAVYYRLRRAGHADRWRDAVRDELLEFDPVRAAGVA
jgi:hypothetical protein